MSTQLAWPEIFLRLGLAFAAGAIIGLDREEHGRPAGLRTTVLVTLAAAGAFVLATLLIDTSGRPSDSFVTMDVMRLPLGILTGVGFIGAGAILHKGNFVLGVTTAATLWFSTVMGFCFGAGELGLGLALLVLGILILWGLRWVEAHFIHRSEATLTLLLAEEGPTTEQIFARLVSAGFHPSLVSFHSSPEGCELSLQVHRRRAPPQVSPPAVVLELRTLSGVKDLRWKPVL